MIDFAALKIDTLLVSHPPNIRYLTGYTGSNGLVLLEPESMILFTDPRYALQAAAEAKQAKLPIKVKVKVVKSYLWEGAASAIKRRKLQRIGFEKTSLNVSLYLLIKDKLELGKTLEPIGEVIDDLRMVKTEDEIARIRESVITNSKAFMAVAPKIKAGMTESRIAADIDYQMRRHGADGTAFETIVAAGLHAAYPHARPTQQKVAANELLLIDMGASQNGYMSDMTRMLSLGKPSAQMTDMYNAVLEAQLAAIASVREGVSTKQVDASARDVLKAVGLDKKFTHSTGHGLGLEIHEAPRVGRKDKTKLKAGMVITIEPGVYVEGVGGVRIEDTVLVTKTGCEVLTPTSKELMVL
jgi:Xaa-Pro aminopeptidase